ncbi:MAG: conjugal transfer protein TraD [Lachnospiraceae bacterium]|nr:conjugal transfer protein TraD [Lachnospiraceae bacterium]
MSTRSYEERLEDLKRRQNQLKEQEKDLRKRVATEERKKRTRRLIEIGGIVQSVLGRPLEDTYMDLP